MLRKLTTDLSFEVRQRLDEMLDVPPGKSRAPLIWLRDPRVFFVSIAGGYYAMMAFSVFDEVHEVQVAARVPVTFEVGSTPTLEVPVRVSLSMVTANFGFNRIGFVMDCAQVSRSPSRIGSVSETSSVSPLASPLTTPSFSFGRTGASLRRILIVPAVCTEPGG